MLEILETGRLPAGIGIPSWLQELLSLAEAPPRHAHPIVPRADKAKEPALYTETAQLLSDKGFLLWQLGRKDEAFAIYNELVRRADEDGGDKAKEPAPRELVANALYNKGLLLIGVCIRDHLAQHRLVILSEAADNVLADRKNLVLAVAFVKQGRFRKVSRNLARVCQPR
jgi:hypothetical protein